MAQSASDPLQLIWRGSAWRLILSSLGAALSEPVLCPTGDFAVLLKAGMTVKQAIVYNLLSAMMAYVGMFIGTAVGQYANNITLWIFAVTAGMFLYVALVDMVRLAGAGAWGHSGWETWDFCGCCTSVWCSGLLFTEI